MEGTGWGKGEDASKFNKTDAVSHPLKTSQRKNINFRNKVQANLYKLLVSKNHIHPLYARVAKSP